MTEAGWRETPGLTQERAAFIQANTAAQLRAKRLFFLGVQFEATDHTGRKSAYCQD